MSKRFILCIVMAAVSFAITVSGILSDFNVWLVALDALISGYWFSEALNAHTIQKYEKALKEVDEAVDRLIECIKEEKENERIHSNYECADHHDL